MRLHPPVTEEEAFAFLKNQAIALWGAESARELEAALKALAGALAAVSAAELPEGLEPLFP